MMNKEQIALHEARRIDLLEAERKLISLRIGYSNLKTVPLAEFIASLQRELENGRTTITLSGIGTVLVDNCVVVLTTEPQL